MSKLRMAVASVWFPPIFALVQKMRHLGMIAYTYWNALHYERSFRVAAFVRQDLARPLFEPYEFCGAFTHYVGGQTALLGLDFPAYAAATILHSAITWHRSCVDALTTPRGHFLSTAFVFVLWFFVGLSIRRMALRRWHQPIQGRISRALTAFGLIPLPLGFLLLLFSVVSLFVLDIGSSIWLGGIASWMIYTSILAAERLCVWPFDRTQLLRSTVLVAGKPD